MGGEQRGEAVAPQTAVIDMGAGELGHRRPQVARHITGISAKCRKEKEDRQFVLQPSDIAWQKWIPSGAQAPDRT
jgi:hypothetical protein